MNRQEFIAAKSYTREQIVEAINKHVAPDARYILTKLIFEDLDPPVVEKDEGLDFVNAMLSAQLNDNAIIVQAQLILDLIDSKVKSLQEQIDFMQKSLTDFVVKADE